MATSSHQQHEPPHPNSTPQRWQVFDSEITARQLTGWYFNHEAHEEHEDRRNSKYDPS
jgi:hypothetical protein